MKRFFAIFVALCAAFVAVAQSEHSIIIDQNSFREIHYDALTGVNIDPIGVDSSRRPCARIKVKINRMSREDIDKLEVKIHSNNQLTKSKTAEYDNGLIIEMTAKNETRFYFHHPEFGYSNEVNINLEPNKEYYLEASLNQTYSIVVNSNVADAEVYLDSVFKGRTDSSNSLTIKGVFAGGHTLNLVYGSVSHEQKIVVNSGNISFRQNVNIAASEPQFVVFTVVPQSAVVIIDGKHYTLQDGSMSAVLASGRYDYTVTAVGYHSQSGTFTVSGETVTRNITLKSDSANVTLTAPDNAEIWVNGAKKGTGRWSGTLNSGAYIFEARKDGHRTAKLTKEITSTQPQQNYTLPAPTPIVGGVAIASTPIGANVTIDGKMAGTTPLKLDNIFVGNHSVKITKTGYSDYTQTVTIDEGKTVTINTTLTKQTAATPAATSPTTTKGVTSAPYKVGDYYNDGKKEGVVFEVWDNGNSGKIVSMTQAGKLQWSSDEAEQKRFVGANSETYGAANMAVIKSISGWEDKYPAFKWCADLGEGWYLPAKEELLTIYSNKAAIDANLTGQLSYYWSSTESHSHYGTGAFYVTVYDGGTDDNVKIDTNYVRAVSAFGNAKPTPEPTPTPELTSAPYKVGDYYNDGKKEGVVFEVSADGKHGKIVSMTQSASTLQWASDETEQKRLVGADSQTDGAVNMAIIKSISGWESKYPAFKWCADLGEGWYLPAKEELLTIYSNKAAIDANLVYKLSSSWYWSSTEYDYRYSNGVFCAWYVGMGSGGTGNGNKNGSLYVRAVSAF